MQSNMSNSFNKSDQPLSCKMHNHTVGCTFCLVFFNEVTLLWCFAFFCRGCLLLWCFAFFNEVAFLDEMNNEFRFFHEVAFLNDMKYECFALFYEVTPSEMKVASFFLRLPPLWMNNERNDVINSTWKKKHH